MYLAETVIAKADEHYEQSYELDRESDREDLKEQQIAFAEWIGKEHLYLGIDGLWHEKPSSIPQHSINILKYEHRGYSTTELYELFLTETKQQ